MTKDEALKLALEALMEHGTAYLGHSKEYQQAISKSKEALAQPEQEPEVCCGDYATCMKPCIPRGRWLAEQEPVAQLWECLGRWSAYLATNGPEANCAPPPWLVEAVKSATTPPAQPEQDATDIAALVQGMEVSVDISTGDHDASHRLFGVVNLVQQNQKGKHGLILLVQDPEPNFKAQPAQPEQEPVATVIKKGADREWMSERLGALPDGIYSLHLAPPKRKPLTKAQIIKIVHAHTHDDDGHDDIWIDGEAIARATEAAHNIKKE